MHWGGRLGMRGCFLKPFPAHHCSSANAIQVVLNFFILCVSPAPNLEVNLVGQWNGGGHWKGRIDSLVESEAPLSPPV